MSAPTPEFVLGYRAMMLDGVARELEITKRVLAAIPDGKRDYRPDPHARTAWELAWHLANTDVPFLDAIADLKFVLPPPAPADKPNTVAAPVGWYDRNVKRGAERAGAFPAAFYLGFLNNHSIHHRGELATYLRPMGSKVPSIYGGSFDEPFQAAA